MKYFEEVFSNNLFFLYKENCKSLRNLKFTQLDETIFHQQVVPYASYSPWESDDGFLSVYNSIKNNTLVDIYRCYELWDIANSIKSGVALEIGVWRGGTGALIASALKNKKIDVFLIDTFEGVVKASEKDTLYKGGEHSDTSMEIVNNLLNNLNLENAKVIKGIFPEDIQTVNFLNGKSISFCHIDVDSYQSAKEIFNFIWDKMSINGVVIFDDYGFWGCEGITKLCNEIKNNVVDSFFIHNLNGHAIFLKISL